MRCSNIVCRAIRNRMRISYLCCFLVFSVFLSAGVSGTEAEGISKKTYSDEDAGRILVANRSSGNVVKGSFYLFCDMVNESSMLCKPFTGVQEKITVPVSCMGKTPYFSDTKPFAVKIDTFYFFSSSKYHDPYSADKTRYRRNKALLQLMGNQDSIEKLIQLEQQLSSLRKQLSTNAEKWYQAKAVIPNNDEEEEAKEALKEQQEEIQKKFAEDTEKVLHLVDEAIGEGNTLQALALICHIRNYYDKYFLVYKYQSLFPYEVRKVIRENIGIAEKSVLTSMKDKLAAQTFAKDFQTLFPDARGIWSQSVPTNITQAAQVLKNLHEITLELDNYSPVSEFDKWGNCCLSLLALQQGQKDAEFLKTEFRNAFIKYKNRFR